MSDDDRDIDIESDVSTEFFFWWKEREIKVDNNNNKKFADFFTGWKWFRYQITKPLFY